MYTFSFGGLRLRLGGHFVALLCPRVRVIRAIDPLVPFFCGLDLSRCFQLIDMNIGNGTGSYAARKESPRTKDFGPWGT